LHVRSRLIVHLWFQPDCRIHTCSGPGGGGGKVQASLAAFLSRGKPATAPPSKAAVSATTAAHGQEAAQPVTDVQERLEPQQEVSHPQQGQQQQPQPQPTAQRQQQSPVHTQEQVASAQQPQPQGQQLDGQGSETYASQLSAAIAASLADARPLAEPQAAPQPATRQVSRAVDNRLPVRTDSYLDIQNNRQYRSWAAFISQAGPGSGGGGGTGQQSAAATAWQVLDALSVLLSPSKVSLSTEYSLCNLCSGCAQIIIC